MSRKSRILDRASLVARRVANRWGVVVTFKQDGVSVTLKAFNAGNDQTTDLHGGDTDHFKNTWIVPRNQTDFPTSIKPGSTITDADNVVWQVSEVIPDAEDLAICATVALKCERYGYDTDI